MTGVQAQERALVLGGSMAGLLAARVLAESYAEVLVVDRDELTGVREARRGVPHGPHIHGLLARGQEIVEELFPGLTDTIVSSDQAPLCDLSGTVRWFFNGRRLAPTASGLTCVAASRPVLESHVRARVAELPNVRFAQRDVLGLTVAGDRVTGARLRHESPVYADLVVDATGRSSRAPAWLEEIGYERPAEDRVKIDLTYTTRRYRLRSTEAFGADVSINPVCSPGFPRGAFFTRIENGLAVLSLTGVHGDRPPTDPEGFEAWARSLPVPDVYEALRDAEPVDDPVAFHFPFSRRRRYERLPRFPEGFLVMGDAVCSFNPVYGQGMTVAALEALTVREHLRRGRTPQHFFAAISSVIDVPWDISAGSDLAYPQFEGKRSTKVKMSNAYMAKLQAAATRDSEITKTFMRVAGLVDPPQALMRPSMLLRVLRKGKPTQPDTRTMKDTTIEDAA